VELGPRAVTRRYLDRRRRRRAAFRARFAAAKQPALDATRAVFDGLVRNEEAYSIASHRSRWSVLSYRSAASALSAASTLSVGSALSFFSAGSILSIGSAGSILSVGSSGSILSIGASGGFLSVGPQATPAESADVPSERAEAAVRRLSGALAIAALAGAVVPRLGRSA
jgi:hypothetical protein